MEPKLEVCRLNYTYHSLDGETAALSNISFSVSSGEFIAIVGPSGCGKSTLLSLLCGLMTPDSGTILLNNMPLCSSGARIGYMLQQDHLFEWRTIFSNVALGLEISHKLNDVSTKKLNDMLDKYGLGKFKSSHPSELSGGMRQRAALIRTLALDPDILLLDEPFSALDYQTRLSVCDDISSIIRSTQKTAVLITHDLSEAISVSDRIVILSERPGRVKNIIDTVFPEDIHSSLERRNSPFFQTYFNQVWKELKNYA